MKNRIALLVLLAMGAVGAGTAGPLTKPVDQDEPGTYRVSTLKSLGGTNARGNSINDTGIVAGYGDLAGGQVRHATVWRHGQPLDLGTLGGPNSSVAWPVKNDIGLVVGIAQTGVLEPPDALWSCRIFFPGPDNAKYQCLGFAWEGGDLIRLPTLGGANGYATAANNHRQVAGWAEKDVVDGTCQAPGGRQFRAVVWDLNTNATRELPSLGDDSAGAATAINDRGQVVGISGSCDQAVGRFSARHAVIWEDGVVRRLDDLGGEAWHTPTAINQRGDMIAGFSTLPGDDPFNPQLRAFLWTTREGLCPQLPGTRICDLGTLDGHLTSQASGINDRGQVVGSSCPASGACHAFLWENGVMKDLNALTIRGFAEHLENAQDINQDGEITGRLIDKGGLSKSAFVASPVPGLTRR